MIQRNKSPVTQLWLITLVMILAPACNSGHPATIVGKWRTAPPASLLFKYMEDGTVVMLRDTNEYIVFHYQIIDNDTLQLVDGMGRIREYDFRLSNDALTFYDDLDSGIIALKHTREE